VPVASLGVSLAQFRRLFPCYLPRVSLIRAADFPVNLGEFPGPLSHLRPISAGSNSRQPVFSGLSGDFSLYFGRNLIETGEHITASTATLKTAGKRQFPRLASVISEFIALLTFALTGDVLENRCQWNFGAPVSRIRASQFPLASRFRIRILRLRERIPIRGQERVAP
jgi:hypothetical protein